MRLIKGQYYSCAGTDLAILVLGTVFEGRGHLKFKGALIRKKCGHVYETKHYKVPKRVPEQFGWKLLQKLPFCDSFRS